MTILNPDCLNVGTIIFLGRIGDPRGLGYGREPLDLPAFCRANYHPAHYFMGSIPTRQSEDLKRFSLPLEGVSLLLANFGESIDVSNQ